MQLGRAFDKSFIELVHARAHPEYTKNSGKDSRVMTFLNLADVAGQRGSNIADPELLASPAAGGLFFLFQFTAIGDGDR